MKTADNKSQKQRVDGMAGNAIKTLMEFCINEKIANPKITMDANTNDKEHYRLVFERLDIDEQFAFPPSSITKEEIDARAHELYPDGDYYGDYIPVAAD